MVTADEQDRRARLERARETGLFRYSLVQELTEPGITAAERGRRARSMAGRAHEGPGGPCGSSSCLSSVFLLRAPERCLSLQLRSGGRVLG